jgi:hypothetical protein
VFIQIVSTPPGEAPLQIRKSWVGLVLPLFEGDTGPVIIDSVGVVSKKRTRFRLFGFQLWQRGAHELFRVPAAAAIDALGQVAPEAAAWWRDNLSSTEIRWLGFDPSCGVLVAADAERYSGV